MAENTRNGNQKSHRERKFKCVPESLHFNAELLCVCCLMYAQFRACILKDTQRCTEQGGTCMAVTAQYVTASCKIKSSLFWAILYSTVCASNIDLVMTVFTWYRTMKECFSLEDMKAWVLQPEGCHKNKLCLWRPVVCNSSVRNNSYWLECSITLHMWMALSWNCHIFFFLTLYQLNCMEICTCTWRSSCCMCIN